MSDGTINFSPLLGASNEEPLSYLLDIDGFKILLDCGWTYAFNTADLEPLLKVLSQIDAILISHSDIYHLGALPYLRKQGLSCPIYATVPVWRMGLLFLKDALQACSSQYKFETFTMEDVDAAFQSIQTLKHLQVVNLTGKGAGISFTPNQAGHSLGGSFWRITKGSEDIIYAVDCNFLKENHLEATLLMAATRPTVLITDAWNAQTELPKRKDRHTQLIEMVIQTVNQQGNVLIPVDTAGRVIELLMMLHQYWELHHLHERYDLVLLSSTAPTALDNVRSMIEWCSEACIKHFDSQRDNPFAFKRLLVCTSLDDLGLALRPRVILASTPELSWPCAALDLLQQWFAASGAAIGAHHHNHPARNLLLFTQRALQPGSVAHQLQQAALAMAGNAGAAAPNAPRIYHVNYESKFNVPLTGAELQRYQQQKNLHSHQSKVDKAGFDFEGDDDEDDDDEDDVAGFQFGVDPASSSLSSLSADPTSLSLSSASLAASPSVPLSVHGHSHTLVALPGRFGTSASYPLYPSLEDKFTVDPFGVAIRPEDYMLPEASEMPSHPAHQHLQQQQQRGARGGVQPQPQQQTLPQQVKEQAKAIEDEIPVSVESKRVELELLCNLRLIDFEGRSDSKGVKHILKTLAPRTAIFIHGTEENKVHLKEYCEKNISICRNIFVPHKGQTLDITADLNVLSIKIKESLESLLRFEDLPDSYQVAWFDGEIKMEGGLPTLAPARTLLPPPATPMSALNPNNIDDLLAMIAEEGGFMDDCDDKETSSGSRSSGDEQEESKGDIDAMETNDASSSTSTSPSASPSHDSSSSSSELYWQRQQHRQAAVAQQLTARFGPVAGYARASATLGCDGHVPLLLGDLKLADVKRALNQEAIQAEFVSGTLVCSGGLVHIRKVSATHISITGSLCEDYYRIREILYAQYEKL